MLAVILCAASLLTRPCVAHAESLEPALSAASTREAQDAAARIADAIKGFGEAPEDAYLVWDAFHAVADDALAFAEDRDAQAGV